MQQFQDSTRQAIAELLFIIKQNAPALYLKIKRLARTQYNYFVEIKTFSSNITVGFVKFINYFEFY